MFVYRQGKLKQEVIGVSPTEQIYRLMHLSSGMVIEVKFDPSSQGSYSTNTNPYKVFKDVNGTYTIYEEFFAKNKSIKENFEEAILFFEDNISLWIIIDSFIDELEIIELLFFSQFLSNIIQIVFV